MFEAGSKAIALAALGDWRDHATRSSARLVVTNGCFDWLHSGHVRFLEQARNLGDLLLVGLNSDRSVRELKGPDRPIFEQADRALLLGALGCVDAVCVFDETRADRFLEIARPDLYVKGGDYTLERLDAQERAAIARHGGETKILPLVPGRSTTASIRNLLSRNRRD